MKRLCFILLTAFLLVGLGCEGEPGEEVDHLKQGWEYFEAGNLDYARTEFEIALDSNPSQADAYNGLGWCDLLNADLANALVNFETAMSYSNLIDAYAGASLSASDEGEHQKAIDYAKIVIGADNAYTFSHYPAVSIEDIRLVKARSSARLGDFDAALTEVRWFLPEFLADPETPEGQVEILAQVEDLIEQYGG